MLGSPFIGRRSQAGLLISEIRSGSGDCEGLQDLQKLFVTEETKEAFSVV